MYKSPKVLYFACFFILLNISHAQVITSLSVEPLSPLRISIQFDEIAATLDSPYVIKDNITGKIIATTIEFSNIISVIPGTNYSFQVCRNLTDNPSVIEACSDKFPFTAPPISGINVIPVDGTFATLVFQPTFVSAGAIDQYTDFYYSLQYLSEGKWEYLASVERDGTTETATTNYFIPFQTEPGQERLYRISLGRTIRSNSFFFTAPSIVKDEFFNGQQIFTFNPSSFEEFNTGSPNSPAVSISESLLLNFDVTSLNQECEIVAARLNINTSPSSNYNGGFINAYPDFQGDVPLDYAFSIARVDSQFIIDDEVLNTGKAVLELDNNIPSTGLTTVSLLNDWRSNINNNGLLLRLLKSDDTGIMVVDNPEQSISLEVALKNPLPVITNALTVDFSFTPNSGTCTGECISAIPPSPAQPIPLITKSFNDIVPANGLLVSVTVQLNNVVADGDTFISVSIGKGAVNDEMISFPSLVCSSATSLTFTSPEYSVTEGGFPGYQYQLPNTLYIQSTSYLCVGDALVTFEFIEQPLAPGCNPNTPPTPSPSPTPSSSPTPSFVPSITPSRSVGAPSTTPSTTPSQTPTRSHIPSTLVGPSSDASPAPVPSKIPSASVSGGNTEISATPSPTRTRSSGTTPDVVPTSIPAEDETVDIQDTDGDIVGVVDLGPNQGEDGDVLIVTPVSTDGLPGIRDIGSAVISLVLVDIFGNVIQPTSDVEICLSSSEAGDDACLGFLDETKNPPRWVCQDECLSKNSDGQFCGSTDHFTSFALLLGGGGADCVSSGDYIIGTWEDGVLIGSITVGVCCFFLIITILLAATPCGSRIIRGKEGHRIARLRSSKTDVFTPDVDSDV